MSNVGNYEKALPPRKLNAQEIEKLKANKLKTVNGKNMVRK